MVFLRREVGATVAARTAALAVRGVDLAARASVFLNMIGGCASTKVAIVLSINCILFQSSQSIEKKVSPVVSSVCVVP